MKECLFMKNMFKRSLAAVMAVASLAVGMVGMSTNAATESANSITSVNMIDEAIAKSRYTFNLINNAMIPVVSITGSKNVDIYAKPTGGSVTVYVYNGGTYVTGYYFDTSGYAPTQNLSIPSGKTYTIYVQSSSASANNPVTGYINIG